MSCRGNAFCARDYNQVSLPSQRHLFIFFTLSVFFPSCQFEIDGGMLPCLVDGPNKGINL